MDEDGGMANYPNNKAGAKFGTGYCDSQCPRDLKFIAGTANVSVMRLQVWTELTPISGRRLGVFFELCQQWCGRQWRLLRRDGHLGVELDLPGVDSSPLRCVHA